MNEEIAIKLADKLAHDIKEGRLPGNDQERIHYIAEKMAIIASQLRIRPYTLGRVARDLCVVFDEEVIPSEKILRRLEP